jgi:hypothetical protein
MAFEDPVHPNSARSKLLNNIDHAFSAIFALEMILKVIALGFAMHPRAYLRSGWNVLDFVVVIVSGLSILLESINVNVSVVRVLRVLRALRTLRSVNKAKKLKQVTEITSAFFFKHVFSCLSYLPLIF